MGYRNVVGNFWLLKHAADVTRKLQPDIVHAPEYLSTAVFASLGIDAPLVLTVPGNIHHRIEHGHSFERHFVQVLKWAANVSARRCAAVIAISQEMKRWWEMTGSAPERTPYIPYGVDINRFRPVPGARRILNLPEDKLVFLYAGRFASEKGLFDLLDAVGSLVPYLDPKKVEFILIGKGPLREELEEHIHAGNIEPYVTLMDWVEQDHLATWYSAADAFLLPSLNEPLGRVILEAMACGTPVIASDVEGPRDHIVNSENGYMYTVRDVAQLASLLKDVIDTPDKLRLMRLGCVEYIEKNLAWPQIIKRIVTEVYEPLVWECPSASPGDTFDINTGMKL